MELRDENQRYRAHLEQRKIDERRQQVELDRLLQGELDRQNSMRAAKQRAEQDKRSKLLHEVIEGRQQQVLDRSLNGFFWWNSRERIFFWFRCEKGTRGQ